MQLVIIAGGQGTRLGLKDIPKPMVEIGGKPLLEHQILLAKRYGIKDIFILSGHLADVTVDYFKDGKDFGVNITHVIEPFPLGTAGSLKLLENTLKSRFMVFYGDIVMDFDLIKFIEFDNKFDSIGTAIIQPNDHIYDSDLVDIDKNNKITKFISKPWDKTKYYKNLVNAAAYIFSPEIFKYIEPDKSQDFGRDILPKIVSENETLMGYLTSEYIRDMGTGDRLANVIKDFTSGKVSRLNYENKRKALFIQKENIIDNFSSQTQTIEDYSLLENVSDSVKKINDSEFLSIIIAAKELGDVDKKMETLIGLEKAFIDGLYYNPQNQEKEMILQAEKDYNIDLAASYIISSNISNLESCKNIGLKTILISHDKNNEAENVFKDFLEAVDFILKKEDLEI